MARRQRRNPARRNPRGIGAGKLAIIGVGALALTSSGVRDAFGSTVGALFNSLGTSVHGQTAQAAGAVAAHSSAYQRMLGANPNVVQQAKQWQGLRAGNGEDPTSWAAFRQFQVGIKAPDPGPTPPPEWPAGF